MVALPGYSFSARTNHDESTQGVLFFQQHKRVDVPGA